MTITQNRFFLSDFVSIQRNSFLQFLEKGLIEEISKRNPINNTSNTLEIFFYSEYYQLSAPKYSPRQAILKGKSYSSRLYIPVQLTDRASRIIKIKWVYLCDLPIMTKRGHFIINGAARVIVNQIIRSPGIYYQTKIYENFNSKWDQTPESSFERHYADLICQRGTWLRLEVDKDKKIWGQTKKGPKIPIMWLLLAMGLTEKSIFQSILDPARLLYNMFDSTEKKIKTSIWKRESSNEPAIFWDLQQLHGPNSVEYIIKNLESLRIDLEQSLHKKPPEYIQNPPEAWSKIYTLFAKHTKRTEEKSKKNEVSSHNPLKARKSSSNQFTKDKDLKLVPALAGYKKNKLNKKNASLSELGRQFIFNKFMNPRTYDLSKYGRLSFNKKLNLSISPNQTTLTPRDLLAATNHLLKVEYGLKKVDDIDNLKNRRVRTSGELIQLQFGTGLLRLEKSISQKMNRPALAGLDYIVNPASYYRYKENFQKPESDTARFTARTDVLATSAASEAKAGRTCYPTMPAKAGYETQNKSENNGQQTKVFTSNFTSKWATKEVMHKKTELNINMFIPNTKAVNSALREFFGTSPLSQFMDQMNPLAEITHKRRLSSMGPGGVTRDSATLDIRGIHPSHYGRICPVETPEGKNTGLVNSLTTYARVNKQGYIETPFYRVFQGQVQKKTGMYFFSADKEEKIRLGAADLFASDIGFLAKSDIPVRIEEDFSKISRDFVEYAGVSPTQMVSIATSLIPFLEHDDANRALMGSNMQRQAVPIINPERPIVGTGFEARVVSDSGHALEAKKAGVVTYVSSEKVIVYSKDFFQT